MHRLVPSLVAALTLAACAKKDEDAPVVASDEGDRGAATAVAPPPDPDKPSSLASAAPTAAATALPETDDPDSPLGAVSLPDQPRCLKRCIQQNQMRAVAPEQIEADCQKSCHTECLSFCKEGQGERPASFADACRADCDEQRDRIQQKR